MTQIRAVLFDIDGTLLDSNDAHAHAWLDSLRGHGKNVPFGHVRSRIGMGCDRLLMEVANVDARSVEGQSINERRSAILKGYYLPDLAPIDGARLLVERLRSRGLLLAAISASLHDDLRDLLRAAGVADLIELAVSTADVSSDHAEANLAGVALEKLGVEASEAVMIGDSPHDIEAARLAGISVIALRCGGFPERSLAGADAIHDDPSALATHLDEPPLSLERERTVGGETGFGMARRRSRRAAYL